MAPNGPRRRLMLGAGLCLVAGFAAPAAAQALPPAVRDALGLPASIRIDGLASARMTGATLWTMSVPGDRAITRLAALVSEPGGRVVGQLRIQLMPDEPQDTTAVFVPAQPVRLGTTDALVLELASLFADREATGFVLFLPDGRILTPPDPGVAIRSLLPKGEQPFTDAQAAMIGTAKARIVMATSPGGLGWLAEPNGATRLWMATPVTGAEGWMAHHRMAVSVYRVTPAGFTPDASWNGGRPWVSPKPVDPDKFDAERIARLGPPGL